MNMHHRIINTGLLAIGLALAIVLAPSVASAAGLLAITGNTTLSANYQGTIRFDANNITLNCAGKSITPSSNTSCGGTKCGILASGRSGITIKNCPVSGFNTTGAKGIEITNSSNVTLSNLYADYNTRGFVLTSNSTVTASQLYARYNSYEGLDLNGTSSMTTNVVVSFGNGGDGVDIGPSGSTASIQNRFSTGTIADNGGNGIEQDGGRGLWIVNFGIYENAQNGISLDDVFGDSSSIWSGAWINGNDIHDQSSPGSWNSDGIRINNAYQVWLDSNSSYFNEGWGGYLDDGTAMTVTNNYFQSCNSQMLSVAGSQCAS